MTTNRKPAAQHTPTLPLEALPNGVILDPTGRMIGQIDFAPVFVTAVNAYERDQATIKALVEACEALVRHKYCPVCQMKGYHVPACTIPALEEALALAKGKPS